MSAETLLRGTELIGQPVVDISVGEDVAEVKDLVFDPAVGTLVGFTLKGRGAFAGRLETVLALDGIASIGTDAVMISGLNVLSGQGDRGGDGVTSARDADEEVTNDLVVTESGRSLGKVVDVIVRGGTSPRVVAFEIDGGEVGRGLIPISEQRSVSASALVVPDEFESRIHHDLTGLASELATIANTADGEAKS